MHNVLYNAIMHSGLDGFWIRTADVAVGVEFSHDHVCYDNVYVEFVFI
jgi:hypothetical protein